MRCDIDLCWLMDEAWTTRFKVTIDAAPCRAPLGLADIPWAWLSRGDMGCETGMDKFKKEAEGELKRIIIVSYEICKKRPSAIDCKPNQYNCNEVYSCVR